MSLTGDNGSPLMGESKMSFDPMTVTWRLWTLWAVAFVAFPLAGVRAQAATGGISDAGRALIGGMIVGATLGAAQFLVLRSVLPLTPLWIVASSLGLGAGLVVATHWLGTATDGNALLWRALIAGAGLAIAQYLLLRPVLAWSEIWLVTVTLGWVVGWFITRAVGVDLAPKWANFGAAGAITFQALTGIALFVMLRLSVLVVR